MASQSNNPGLTSIVSYPDRGEGGNNKYRGNCSPKLVEDLLRHFKAQQISDYMCGSNSTKAAADKLGVESHTFDLHSGFDMLAHEIPDRPEFIFWHPPYHDIVRYADSMYSAADVQQRFGYDPCKSDLSQIKSWEEFVKVMNNCMMKQFTALETGGRMAVLVGDIKKKGKLYSMIFELIKPGIIENVIIKAQYNCMSNSRQYSGNFIPILHEYVLLLKKAMPLSYPVMMSFSQDLDIRNMPGAAWKDILADAMESFSGAAPLERIYAAVGGYARTQSSAHWQDKVRQTLQYHPNLFCSVQRGVWALRKTA